MITEPLDDAQIKERILSLSSGSETEEEAGFKFVRPLSEAANNLIDVIRNPEGRILFGCTPEIDVKMRGIGKGELCYISGFTTSGKTQLFLNIIRNHSDKAIVLFTMDEPAEMVLSKLVAMDHGWDFNEVEEQVKAGNEQFIDRIKRSASEKYRKLIVVDQSVSTDDMSAALREAEKFLNVPCVDLVGVDYLRLLRLTDENGEHTVGKKSTVLKAWVQDEKVPCLCITQASRSKGAGGQKLGLDGMEYGGECVAGGTLIDLWDGQRRSVELIELGALVAAWDSVSESYIPKQIIATKINEPRPGLKITTNRGRIIECSENHPFMTDSGWVNADELVVNSPIKVALGHIGTSMDTVTPDEAYLLGAMVGDGATPLNSRNRTSFTNDDPGVIEAVRAVVETLGGRLAWNPDYPISYTISGQVLRKNPAAAFLREHIGGLTAFNKHVPDAIYSGGEKVWAAFLSGMIDTDGTIADPERTHFRCEIFSVSRSLLEGCQSLFARLGVQSTVRAKKEKYHGGVSWRLQVVGGASALLPVLELFPLRGRKMDRFEAFVKKQGRWKVAYRKDRGSLDFDLVEKIETLGLIETHLLEVEDLHNHVTNGLVTHNSEAHFVITVRRLLNDESLDENERAMHENTVNVGLVKSKRLPVRLGEHTFQINPTYGIIGPHHHAPEPFYEQETMEEF